MGSIFKTTFSEVTHFYPVTRIAIVLTALVFSFQIIPETIANIVAIIFVITIGLMHGATDHILYVNSEKATFKSKIPKPFIVKYLLILGAMGIVWLLLPTLALVFFLAISAYHFGQTQLQYIPVSEGSYFKKALYLSWGLLMLSLIVLLNLQESKSLISSAIPAMDLIWLDAETSQVIILTAGGVFLAICSLLYRYLTLTSILFEVSEILIISLLAYESNLIVSFGIFFGLWHSLRASQVQVDKINGVQNYSFQTFIRESLPFTIISILGIAFMILIASYFESAIRIEMLFLVAISMLTLPHMFIYERFYDYFDKRKL